MILLLNSTAWSQKNQWLNGPNFASPQKTASKEKSRWTLKEWLEQKDRNHLMDLWLGMYSPSPYEFYLSGAFQSYDNKVSTDPSQGAGSQNSYRSYSGSVGAYALIVGLVGEHENNSEESYNDTAGSFNLRVLGNSVQGTHLILNYGQRTRNQAGNVHLNQQFAGADLDLYVIKFFGLHGQYRQYMPTTETSLGDIKASRSEAGAFIDFGPLRIFGNWYSEVQNATLNSTTTKTNREVKRWPCLGQMKSP